MTGVLDHLLEGVVEIEFTKADGSNRVMLATLNLDKIKEVDPNYNSLDHTEDNLNKPDLEQMDLIPVYDTEKAAWRSFKPERLTAYRILP